MESQRYIVFNLGQERYIVDTQAAVEVGDWVILDNSFLDKALKVEDDYVNNFNQFSKIIASTDTLLELPVIPQSFIELYIANPNLQIQEITYFNNTVEVTTNLL